MGLSGAILGSSALEVVRLPVGTELYGPVRSELCPAWFNDRYEDVLEHFWNLLSSITVSEVAWRMLR